MVITANLLSWSSARDECGDECGSGTGPVTLSACLLTNISVPGCEQSLPSSLLYLTYLTYLPYSYSVLPFLLPRTLSILILLTPLSHSSDQTNHQPSPKQSEQPAKGPSALASRIRHEAQIMSALPTFPSLIALALCAQRNYIPYSALLLRPSTLLEYRSHTSSIYSPLHTFIRSSFDPSFDPKPKKQSKWSRVEERTEADSHDKYSK